MLSSVFPMLPYSNKKKLSYGRPPGGHLKFYMAFVRAGIRARVQITPTKNVIFSFLFLRALWFDNDELKFQMSTWSNLFQLLLNRSVSQLWYRTDVLRAVKNQKWQSAMSSIHYCKKITARFLTWFFWYHTFIQKLIIVSIESSNLHKRETLTSN